ncbi:MAG: sulfur oxidation c-type cytochrome SoxX [Burkholderiaceae bacterium]|nr:sulfur oxidation c-type cytochrome SoxX [Burkholderiaceae bacterium]
MNKHILIAVAASAALLAGCASLYSAPSREETVAVIKDGFRDRGIAKVDRLNQSELQAACSDAAMKRTELSKEVRERLQKAALDTVKYPSDGKWLGDFKLGERIAQSGVGLQFSDNEKTVNGGNCYACHELTKQEISYGNIGPTLYNYGKLRGNSEPILRYTWGKIWNTHAYNACSSMPPYGQAGILSEEQIKHVMALLLDPNSPVNK